MPRYPQRINIVHVESIDGELCVYDSSRRRVHSLNHVAAFVWQRCDGRTSPAEMALALADEISIEDAEAVVALTLDELVTSGLLTAPSEDVTPLSRRELIRRGVAATALPAIYSIVAPEPAAAQSAPEPPEPEPPAPADAQTFGFTGAAQSFVVPAGVFEITIEADGASGGAGFDSSVGGDGGRATASVSVTPGEILTVRVGGVGPAFGLATAGGFNGGGMSGTSGGRGGGASSVHRGSTPLVIAGGGGGGGSDTVFGPGGDGGGLVADPGGSSGFGGGAGGGGTQAAGGEGGTAGPSGTAGTAGTSGTGGSGGTGVGGGFGGGGGGGFFGGGGGGGGTEGAGGGGGSSFTEPGATGVVHAQGANSGNGSVTISW